MEKKVWVKPSVVASYKEDELLRKMTLKAGAPPPPSGYLDTP